jgi:hypothetical protein
MNFCAEHAVRRALFSMLRSKKIGNRAWSMANLNGLGVKK